MMLQGERAPAGVAIIGLQAGKPFASAPTRSAPSAEPPSTTLTGPKTSQQRLKEEERRPPMSSSLAQQITGWGFHLKPWGPTKQRRGRRRWELGASHRQPQVPAAR